MAGPTPETLPLRAQIEARHKALTTSRSSAVGRMLMLREQCKSEEQNVASIEGAVREVEKILTLIPPTPVPAEKQ